MRSRDLRLLEFAPNRTNFARIVNDASIRMGFECEMITDVEKTTTEYVTNEAPDYDRMVWSRVEREVNISNRTQDKIQEELQEWVNKKADEELAEMWANQSEEYTLQWCIENGHLESADDPKAAEIVAEYADEARDEFYDANRDDVRDGIDEDMDDFIEDEYNGSNISLMDHYDIEYESDDEREEEVETDVHDVYQDMANSLERVVGREVIASSEVVGRKDPDYWYIESDSSLEDQDDHIGAEVVSCVYPLDEGLSAMQLVFKWMARNSYTTNDSTGMHVSFSIEGKTDADYDFLKMVMLFDENYTASLFDRLGNTFCQQMREVLFKQFKTLDPATVMSDRQIEQTVATLRRFASSKIRYDNNQQIGNSKYFSFRHRANGVVEFRSIGGENYEDSFDIIRKRVVNMAYLMVVGSDPTAMAREYVKRVYKMLTSTKYADPALGSGEGRIDQPSLLSSFKEQFAKQPVLLKQAVKNPMLFVQSICELLASKSLKLTPTQIRQLRFYIARNKITPDSLQKAFNAAELLDNDFNYNQIAPIMRWPIVVPGEHDPRQQTFPFAKFGRDMSGTAQPPAQPPARQGMDNQVILPSSHSWQYQNYNPRWLPPFLTP